MPIGNYSAGCLQGAESLPLSGPAFVVMHPERKRYFGHPELLSYIKSLASTVRDNHLGILLVGDMGRPRGGPMISGHASHQIGLDVDLWYSLPKKAPRKAERSRLSAGHFTANGKLAHWNKKLTKLLELAIQNPSVDRIFVNPIIKQSLCRSEKEAAWLHKIRPWWGHDDHFHVRLNCPAGSNQCQPGTPIPDGPGCDSDLAWWFSEDAKKTLIDRGKKERVFPVLPAACAALSAQ